MTRGGISKKEGASTLYKSFLKDLFGFVANSKKIITTEIHDCFSENSTFTIALHLKLMIVVFHAPPQPPGQGVEVDENP